MAYPTNFGEMLSYMSLLMQDTSTTAPALTDTQKQDLINDKYHLWTSEINPRVEFQTPFSFGSANQFTQNDVSSDTVSDVLSAYSVPVGSSYDSAVAGSDGLLLMEKIELHEMIALHESDSSDSSIPTKWSYRRKNVSGATKSQIEYWIHPRSDGDARIAPVVRKWVTSLSTAADLPDVSPEEIGAICRLAAWEGARLAGRSTQFRDGIIAGLPEKAQMYVKKYHSLTKPVQRLQEETV